MAIEDGYQLALTLAERADQSKDQPMNIEAALRSYQSVRILCISSHLLSGCTTNCIVTAGGVQHSANCMYARLLTAACRRTLRACIDALLCICFRSSTSSARVMTHESRHNRNALRVRVLFTGWLAWRPSWRPRTRLISARVCRSL